MKTLSVKLLQRSDTEKNWESTNPVLGEDELGFVKNSGNFKIGDGSKKWSELPLYESLSPDDRSKLDSIASGANKTTVDSALSSTSTNPVQNKVVNSALAGKSNTNHTHDLSTMINTLTTGTATPNDDDYYVSQYAGGGTTTTTYHRRPLKALFEYIKGKLHKVAVSGSYNDLSNKPTIPSVGNGTITIKQAGAVKGSFTTNQSGATTIELTDNNTNTWRDVIDNLTSTATDKSLSAAQGKVLNDKFASYVPTSRTVNGKALSANISLNASDVGASASGHTHNYVKDAGNNSSTTFAYSKAGMEYGDYEWVAGWNGYELRAVNKNQFAASGHSHNYFSNHTREEGFEFGFQYSKDINIAKTTAVTTYYVKIVEDGSFRFKNFYVKTYGNNTQYSFKMQAFAYAYMRPNAIVNSQIYNAPEIKNVIFAKSTKNTCNHDIYLEIDSATSYDKKIFVRADSSLVGTQTTTKPSNIELTVAIRNEDFIYSSKKAYFPKGIDGTASAVPWSGITGKPSTFTPSSHTHDDRYYTESEVDSKLSGKANTSHNHTISQITDIANASVKSATSATTAASAQSVEWNNVKNKPSTYTPSTHNHDNSTITSVDASKITTGTIDIARLPQGALERCVIVADDTARFKLTKSNVQIGDTVKVTGTGKMYFVINDSKLTSEDGYTVYTAGSATSAPWSGITGKPATYPPSSHNHDSSYLKLTGGVMTGNISYKGSKNTYEMIKFIDNTSDIYGNGVVIGGGGATIVGGGESADAAKSLLSNGGDEKLFLTNDGNIDFYTNCNNGIAGATHTYIDTNGIYSGKANTAGTADVAKVANSVTWANVSGKPSTFTPATHNHDSSYLKLTGGTLTGNVTVASSPASSLTLSATGTATGSMKPEIVLYRPNVSSWKIVNDVGNFKIVNNYTTSVQSSYFDVLELNYNSGNANVKGTVTASGFIGNATSASSADTATKLSSSAGSATRPVYFSDGKPVAGTYTLANACSKTTRTLTNVGASGWKDASTDSQYVPDMTFMAYWNGAYSNTSSNLAYCNKGAFGTAATKDIGDFATSDHTHTSVKDSNDGGATTFAYSKAGMNYGDYNWVAAWNGKELRAVNKTQFATAGHNHDSTYLKLSGGTVTGDASFTKGTASTSMTTGTVKVTGGVGVTGRVSAKEVSLGDGAVISYNSTNKCIDFTFN